METTARWRRPLRVGVLAAALLSLCAVARAQSTGDDVRRARALFDEGVTFAQREAWREAADRFRRALEIRYAPAVAYNLARALFSVDDLDEADRLLVRALSDEGVDAELAQRVRELRVRIGERAAMVTIVLQGDTQDVTVRLDGATVPAERLLQPVLVPPGNHIVTASRGDRILASADVVAQSGEAVAATLALSTGTPEPTPPTVEPPTVTPPTEPVTPPVAAEPPSPAVAASATQAAAAADDRLSSASECDCEASGSIFADWRFWAVTAGVVVLVLGTVILVAALNQDDEVVGTFEPGVIRW